MSPILPCSSTPSSKEVSKSGTSSAFPFYSQDESITDASSSDEFEEADCPICLDKMSPSDRVHELQCIHHCGYNFCRTCIQSFISSSKDDYMEASDGNMHVKIFLNCPNCRSDLSGSIRDTLLLRRAHSLARRVKNDQPLLESDLRMQKAMKDDKVRKVLAEALAREEEFFGHSTDDEEDLDDYEDDEDWGVEADIIHGVHRSFHCPPPPSVKSHKMLVDRTLFSGLANTMSEEQQKTLTHLLTSGDPANLAMASKILDQVASEREGRRRSSSRRNSQHRASITRRGAGSRRGSRASLRGSVYMLISEAERIKEKTKKKDARANIALALMEIEREADFLRTHPLPVRMPTLLVLNVADALPLTFCDDTWDGTVLDAFCKINIGLLNIVTKQTPRHHGVRHILNSDGPVRVDTEKRRVLVASVLGDCGRQGVMKGDVVTHVNGKSFEGDAEELVAMIQSYAAESSNGRVQLVLNAERAIAEALKLRSLAADDF